MYRREYIATLSAVGVGMFAGCSDDSGDDGTKDEKNETTGDENETTGDENETTGDEDGTTDGDDGTTDGEEDTPLDVLYGEYLTYEDNFIVEGEIYDDNGDVTATHTTKIHGDDQHTHYVDESKDRETEVYTVDGDVYVVSQGQCFLNPGSDSEPEVNDGRGFKEDVPDPMEPSGTTEIDGEVVYIFESEGENMPEGLTVYVSKESGYLVRAETNDGMYDFNSWGEVDPISPPDMNCTELSEYT